MSKFKREKLKKQKQKNIDGNGETIRTTSIKVESGEFSESISRDAAVMAQLLNDYPHKEGVNIYFAESMGVLMLDLNKETAKQIFKDGLENEEVVSKIGKSRLMVVRFKG